MSALILSLPLHAYAQSTPEEESADPANSAKYGVPFIVDCPDGYTGDMTVFNSKKGWRVSKWNCSNFQGLVKKYVLEAWLKDNPPEIGEVRRWETKCPIGMAGFITMNAKNKKQFVESWTCSSDGMNLVTWDVLRPAIERNNTEDTMGLAQTRACPAPYKGNYTAGFWVGKWQLLDWTCAHPGSGKKLSEQEIKLLVQFK